MKKILPLGVCKAWLAAALLSPNAFATPPLIAHIDDRLIAESETHIYVQRQVRDNQGSHGKNHSKTYLLKIDISSGKTLETHLTYTATSRSGEPDALKPKANKTFSLFKYLEEEMAVLIGSDPKMDVSLSFITSGDTHFVTHSAEVHNGETSVIQLKTAQLFKEALRVKANQSVEPTMDRYIGPIPDPIPNVELYMLSTTFESDCDIGKLASLSGSFTRDEIYLLYLECPASETWDYDLFGNIILPVTLDFTASPEWKAQE